MAGSIGWFARSYLGSKPRLTSPRKSAHQRIRLTSFGRPRLPPHVSGTVSLSRSRPSASQTAREAIAAVRGADVSSMAQITRLPPHMESVGECTYIGV